MTHAIIVKETRYPKKNAFNCLPNKEEKKIAKLCKTSQIKTGKKNIGLQTIERRENRRRH